MFFRYALLKAEGKPLYVSRPVTNADEVLAWFRDRGCTPLVTPDDMHVTILYSKKPVNWHRMGKVADRVDALPSDNRRVAPLGDKGATVLHFECDELTARHEEMVYFGGSSDYPTFQPHVTLSYNGTGFEGVPPFPGTLIFGRERFEEITKGWTPDLVKEDDLSAEDLDRDGGSLQPEDGPSFKRKKRKPVLEAE